MPNEPLPVTPAVITWAREREGLSLDDLRGAFVNIEVWENGEGGPTYPQLERLSERLKVPVAAFFFPAPPALPPISESFRTLPQAEFDQIPPRIHRLLRKARAFQLNLQELSDGRNPSNRPIVRQLEIGANENVIDIARRVRDFLGVAFAVQTAWRSVDEALSNWREVLFEVGIFVFKDSFGEEDYSGFCLYDDEFPIIYVNNNASKTRQIFTLFHELAHLLFHTSGVDSVRDAFIAGLPFEDAQIEILCNQFSAEFLLPLELFDQEMQGRHADRQTAEELAARYCVSREVIYRRFLDRGTIDQAEYSAAVQHWNAQRGPRRGGGDWYRTQLAYLGRGYVSLALSQFHQNRITETQLGEFLNTKPRNLATLETYFVEGAA